MFVYKIEQSLGKLHEYLMNTIKLQTQNSIKAVDFTRNVKLFIARNTLLCNRVLDSLLHQSLRHSYQRLVHQFQQYYQLFPFHQDLQQRDIEHIQPFSVEVCNIKDDINHLVSIYQDIIQVRQQDNYIFSSPVHMALGIRPFITLKFKLNNTKKRIKQNNIIKFILRQRNKIFHPALSTNQIISDMLRDNHDEITINRDTFLRSTDKSHISRNRLGWFSWKKLKVNLSPSLEDVEHELNTHFINGYHQVLSQKQISSINQTFQIQNTKLYFENFHHFLNELMYH